MTMTEIEHDNYLGNVTRVLCTTPSCHQINLAEHPNTRGMMRTRKRQLWGMTESDQHRTNFDLPILNVTHVRICVTAP